MIVQTHDKFETHEHHKLNRRFGGGGATRYWAAEFEPLTHDRKSYAHWRTYTGLNPDKTPQRPQIRTKIRAAPGGPATRAG
jgi:hypothetical protein